MDIGSPEQATFQPPGRRRRGRSWLMLIVIVVGCLRTSVDLTRGQPRSLGDGWVVAFSGKWDGPALVLTDHDNSFTEAFTPAWAIRRITSTADAGTAAVTLRYGSSAAFARGCRALAEA